MKIPPWVSGLSVIWIIPLLTAISSVSTEDQYRWLLPLPGVSPGAIISAFDPPASQFGAGHRGVDFPASQGEQVTAVGSGVVLFAGSIAGKPVVSIELANPIGHSSSAARTTYEPVSALVATGDFVYAGTVIGLVDFSGSNAGHCRGSCLHFGLKVMTEPSAHYLNPMILWRSSALLQPSLGVHRSLIAGEQFQRSSEAARH